MKLAYATAVLLTVFSVASAQENYMIRSISFVGNNSFSDGDLRSVILTKESPASFFRFTYKIIRLGGPPQYLDPFVLKADSARIAQLYHDNGFFYARVRSALKFDAEENEVDVSFQISEGPTAYIKTATYHGIPDSSENFLSLLYEKPLVTPGMRYSAKSMYGEVGRIISLLQDDGYAYARKDSSVVTITSIRSDSVGAVVNLYFSSGRKYYWGDLSVISLDSAEASSDKHIVLREMLFTTGEAYSVSKKGESEQRVDALNLYEPVKIATPVQPPGIDTLTGLISLKTRPMHEVTLGPLVNDENNAFNFGGQLEYLHRNFLGDARLFTLSTSLQLQSFQLVTFSSKALSDTVTVGRIDASAELTQPYFFSNSTSLTWGVSFLVDKQMPYVQLVLRNKVRISERIAEYTTGYLDWDIERAKVDSLQAISLPAGLETPQFNSILSFTLQRDKTNDISSPTKGFFNLITIEEGGVIPNLIHSVFPHSNFPYAQYWKFILLGKWFFSTNENSTNVLALKARFGYAQEYGSHAEDTTGPIPLNYRFFAGGSGSIRGWRTRELGHIALPEYGGNTLVETTVEDRFQLIGDFGGVVFMDAGNLWNTYKDITFKTLATAIGFGIRYNTFFGPLRVDIGNRLYDPSAIGGQQFIFQQNGATFMRQLVVHFGIGQAF